MTEPKDCIDSLYDHTLGPCERCGAVLVPAASLLLAIGLLEDQLEHLSKSGGPTEGTRLALAALRGLQE